MSRCLILVGFKVCGKTSVGQRLAQQVQWSFLDTDRLLEAQHRSGQTCAQIYQTLGQSAFRALEKTVIAGLEPLIQGKPTVIATGGGTVVTAQNRTTLRRLGTVVYLSASYATLLARLRLQPAPASLSGDLAAELQSQLAEREPLYREMADWVFDTEQYSLPELVDKIRTHLL